MIYSYSSLRVLPLALLLAFLSPTVWTQDRQDLQGDVIMLLKEARPGFGIYLVVQAKAAGRASEAHSVLYDQLKALSCDHSPQGWPAATIQCGAIAAEIQALDPEGGVGEAMLVRWVEAFLGLPNRPSSKEIGVIPGQQDSFGQYSTEYKEWSRKQGWSPQDAAGQEIGCSMLIQILGSMGDPKLIPLFRRGLAPNSQAILIASTVGLALLKEKEALPAILAAARSLKEQEYNEVLAQLLHFDDPNVDRLIQTRITDKGLRERVKTRPRAKVNPAFRTTTR